MCLRALCVLYIFAYALFISILNLSAIIAINSELVGFPLLADTVYPKILSTVFWFPLPQATSIECLIALSTLDGVVLYFFALSVYCFFIYSKILSSFMKQNFKLHLA